MENSWEIGEEKQRSDVEDDAVVRIWMVVRINEVGGAAGVGPCYAQSFLTSI